MASARLVRHQRPSSTPCSWPGSKGSLRDYLVRAVGANVTWDQIFRELMLAGPERQGEEVARSSSDREPRTSTGSRPTSARPLRVNISCGPDATTTRWSADWKQDQLLTA